MRTTIEKEAISREEVETSLTSAGFKVVKRVYGQDIWQNERGDEIRVPSVVPKLPQWKTKEIHNKINALSKGG